MEVDSTMCAGHEESQGGSLWTSDSAHWDGFTKRHGGRFWSILEKAGTNNLLSISQQVPALDRTVILALQRSRQEG